jgi:parallel beta-helix repeat protein
VVFTLWFSFSFADTTWVAGEVYGVWDTSGSPYMVTDTITVPLDSTLEIRPGVEIWFLDQEIRRTPILVHGRLRAIGEEGDSVYFYSPLAGFGGIRNEYTHGTEIRLEYCVIDSMDTHVQVAGIYSSHGVTVVRHCRLHTGLGGICSSANIDTIQYCHFHGGGANTTYGQVVFQHNQSTIMGLTTYGTQAAPIFDNQVRFIDLEGVNAVEVFDNDLYGAAATGGSSHWYHNRIDESMSITSGSVLFEDNEVGRLYVRELSGTIQKNIVDSDYLYCIRLQSCNSLEIKKNLLIGNRYGIEIMGGDNNVIMGNTIIFGEKGVYSLYTGDHNLIVNNIFVGDGVSCTGVYSSGQDPFIIRHNDFHQVNSVTYGCQLDTANIFLDPCFRAGSPYDYRLQANSPCINAGDPASPLDPDGTRADMGAYYYDQLHDQPPALISPVVVNVQEATTLRYVARATDDYGPLRFGFWELPGWMHIVHGGGTDWVADSAVVSGRVPYGQEHFTFGVWVEDGLAQRDSQEVSVLVSPYTILAGEVTGVLTQAQSPYLVVEDVVVPAGDSLRIEPGVEIHFQWEPEEDLRHRILVGGTLRAVGNPQDSIHFVPEYGDSLLKAWRGIWCLSHADTARIEYACLLCAQYGVVADSQASISVSHSQFLDTYYGIWIRQDAWCIIDSSSLIVREPNNNILVYVNGGSAMITNSQFEFPQSAQYGNHFFTHSSPFVSLQRCVFLGGPASHFDYSSYGEFIGNRVTDVPGGISISNGSRGIVTNNIFTGGNGTGIYGGDSILVSNNLNYRTEIGVYISQTTEQTYIVNNIFFANNTGVWCSPTIPFDSLKYNDFIENINNFHNCIADSTNLYLDPIFQDSINFRLSLGSPCIDAGDPDPFFNDPDSTRNDMGCWGGPWGESYPYVFIQTPNPEPLPLDFDLLPPFPNPFNSVLVIPFTLPIEKEVTINIYNILGQKVQAWTLPHVPPGVHRVVWNSGLCASGIYLVRMNTNGQEYKEKVVLLK